MQVGAPMPRALQQQRWSPLTVPLLWEAAGDSPTCPVVDWLLRTSGRVVDPVHLHENNVTVSQVVTLGWSSLRGVLRVHSREDLTVWLREHGYPGAQPGNHITARAQEHLFHRASGVDARVSLLEVAFVTIVLHMGRQGRESGRAAIGSVPSMPTNSTAERIGEVDWSQLDFFSLEELFLLQVPMLRSCPHFLRNRLRECFGFALRERFRAKVVADVEAEIRAWKLFGVIPMMLLHKPQGVGSVGRSELAQRVNLFQRGSWAQLIHQACAVPRERSTHRDMTEEEEHARRGKAAQNRVQMGQVSRARQELTGASVAPRNAATLEELRRRRPQQRRANIPEEVTNFVPEDELVLESKLFAVCLRSAPSGSAPGPGGCTNEILRVCLDDKETLLMLIAADKSSHALQSRTPSFAPSCWPT